MTGYAVDRLDEIDELTDGRCPYRPVRHHFGITAFGINAGPPARRATGSSTSTTRRTDANEELYLVLQGAPCSSSTASGWSLPPARSSSPGPA